MKKIFYLVLFSFALTTGIHAQVTIGKLDPPHRGAVLELKSDTLGFLPPRIELQQPSSPLPIPVHVEGLVVYNTQATDSLTTGLYYNNGSRWLLLSTSPYYTEKWFYMPSIPFDVSAEGTGFTKDLYQECKNQLNSSSAPVISSAGAPTRVLATMPAKTDLYYYVTDYDPAVFENISIDANGLMTYDVIGQATDATLINIVFVEK